MRAFPVLQPGDIFGDYTVVKLLGQGGMGSVFLLKNAEGGQVAAKILDPASAGDHESRKRFVREAELALGVKHPNLVETYDVGEDPDTGLCYILMEYVSGGSLADRLDDGPLPINDAIRIVYQIASVLELAREKGIVHRDIKPANIMFGADGKAKLADLGIARGGVGGANVTTVTQTGVMIGTPAYMAPEQMLDAHHVDSRADIYSLGIVFYEMLAGQRPHPNDTVVQLMAKAVAGEPIPDVRKMRPEVSAAVAELVSLMCAMKTDERVATPREVTTALSQIAHGREVTIRRKAPAMIRERRRKPFSWKILIPVGFLASLAAAFAILTPRREAQQGVTTNVIERVIEKNVVVTNTVDRNIVQTRIVTNDLERASVSRKAVVSAANSGVRTSHAGGFDWNYLLEGENAVLVGSLGGFSEDSLPAVSPYPSGRLTVPAELDGHRVVAIGHKAFFGCRDLEAIVIPEGVVSIGAHAFHGCSRLASVRIPAGVESIGMIAFVDCISLTNVAFAGDAPKVLNRNGLFGRTPEDMTIAVKRGTKGWNPSERWPPGDKSARRIRYADEGKTSVMTDGKMFDWLENPPVCTSNAEIMVGFCPKWQKPNEYFAGVLPGTKVRYVQNREMEACDLRDMALVFMFSCDAPDYEVEAENVRRCLDLGLNVVFVAHTPNDVRERLLDGYGLHYGRIPDGMALAGVCPGLRNVPILWQPMGQGRILKGNLGWRAMIASGHDRQNVILAMRPCGKGRLFFLAESRRPRDGARDVDFGWWNRVLRGCGIGVCDPTFVRTSRATDPSQLRDEDPTRAVQKALNALFPGWKTSEIGNSGSPGYWRKRDGEEDVVCTHPPRRGVPAVLSRALVVEGKSPVLHVRIANNDHGSQFRLRVRVTGKVVREKDIASGWTDVYVDLQRWRGKKIKIELEHLPTGWSQEWAFWSKIEIVDDATLVEVASVQDKDEPVKMLDRKKVVGANPKKAAQRTCDVLFPGWRISECGHLEEAGYEEEHAGRYNLLFTHPPREDVPVVISRRLTLPRNEPKLYVSVIGGGDFELQVKVNGKVIQRPDVNGSAWTDLTVDLSKWAGRNVLLEVLNMPTGWRHEEAHWQRIEVK